MNAKKLLLAIFFILTLAPLAQAQISLSEPILQGQGFRLQASLEQEAMPLGSKLLFEIFDKNLGIRSIVNPLSDNSIFVSKDFDFKNFSITAFLSHSELQGSSAQVSQNICSGYVVCTESGREIAPGKARLSASISKNFPVEDISSAGFFYRAKDSTMDLKFAEVSPQNIINRNFSIDVPGLLSGREYEYWPMVKMRSFASGEYADHFGPAAGFKTSGAPKYLPEEGIKIKANDPMVLAVGNDLTYNLSGNILGDYPKSGVLVGFKFWQKNLVDDILVSTDDVSRSRSTVIKTDGSFSLNVTSANLGVLTSKGLCYKAYIFDSERNILTQSQKACTTFLNIPYYNIHDYPWCNIMTGGGSYTVIGCRHAATTMVIEYWYKENSMVKKNWDSINKKNPDPVECREMFLKYGLWGDMYNTGPMAESLWTKLNISAIHVGPASAKTIKQVYTDNGVPVIILCRPSLNTCRFWDPASQHQLVIVGYKNFNSYIKEGKKYLNQFYVNDNGYENPVTHGTEGGKMRFVRFDDLLTGEKHNTNCNSGCGWQYPSPRSGYSAFEDEGIVALAPNNLKIKGDLFFYNTIAIKNNEITPWLIKIKAGYVVNWLNMDDMWRSVNILQKGKNIAYSGIIEPGNYFTYKFTTPGEYTFELIGGANQKGRIAVVR